MRIGLTSRKTISLFHEYKHLYPSRRAAFRAAKRDSNIPVTDQPKDVILPFTNAGDEFDLDDRNVRLYIFHLLIGGIVVQQLIREDKEAFYIGGDEESNQGPHFNSGKKGGKLKAGAGSHYSEVNTSK